MRFLLRLWVDSSQDGSWRFSLVDIKESERRLSFKNLEALNVYLTDLTCQDVKAEDLTSEEQLIEKETNMT